MTLIRAGVPVTPDQQQAQQMAQQELAQGKYHTAPPAPSTSPSATVPTTPTPTPTPAQPPAQHSSSVSTTLLVIVLIVVLGTALLLILRKIGRPHRDVKAQKQAKEEAKQAKVAAKSNAAPVAPPLTGAALMRYNAEQAAAHGDWQEAIRERFRAVIAVLDERGLLRERRDRTADEAARDAGEILPEHAAALAQAALAFDEVEYGEYLGSAEGYRVISAVDDAVSTREQPAVRR
jgi:hypothetical protein